MFFFTVVKTIFFSLKTQTLGQQQLLLFLRGRNREKLLCSAISSKGSKIKNDLRGAGKGDGEEEEKQFCLLLLTEGKAWKVSRNKKRFAKIIIKWERKVQIRGISNF